MSSEAKYGWFSPKQAKVTGTIFYERADGNGEVEVTQVSDDARTPKGWDDFRAVGKVTKYLRKGAKSEALSERYEKIDLNVRDSGRFSQEYL